jgi:hypothetical protein
VDGFVRTVDAFSSECRTGSDQNGGRHQFRTPGRLPSESAATEALEVIRSLIERVVRHPTRDDQRGFEIELIGEIAAMVTLGRDDGNRDRRVASATDQALFQSSIKVVAGTGNHRQLTPVMVAC